MARIMTLDTFEDVVNFILSSSSDLYVRWSRSISADLKTGRSKDHDTGAWEAGLSVLKINHNDIAQSIVKYAGNGRTMPYILTGEETGDPDSDGCPTLTAVSPLAKLSLQAVEEAWNKACGL